MLTFFHDAGLKRSQQMFADLNRHAVKPSTSLGILYDHRDDQAEISRQTVTKTRIFKDLVEMEKTALSARSRRLFTFSAIHSATAALLSSKKELDIEEASNLASEFWQEISGIIPEWEKVRKGEVVRYELDTPAQARLRCWGLRRMKSRRTEILYSQISVRGSTLYIQK